MTDTSRSKIEEKELEFFEKYYDGTPCNKLGDKLRLERMITSLKHLSKEKHFNNVLSIGCGDGEFEILFSKHTNHIHALDLSPKAIENANKKIKEKGISNVSFEAKSFFDLNLDQKYDLITCIAFLHHVPEKELESFIKTAYDHLNPGGIFFSQDPNINGILRSVGRVLIKEKYSELHSPDERELVPNELADTCKKIGFSEVKLHYLDFFLIPSIYLFPYKFTFMMPVFKFVDSVLSFSPIAHLSSGFSLLAKKK